MRYPAGHENLRAPHLQFRVIAVDIQEASGTYLIGDFPNFEAAHAVATGRAGVGAPVYIYNDCGELILRLGSWH